MSSSVLLHLSLIDGVGPLAAQRIMRVCVQRRIGLEEIYAWRVSEFMACQLPERVAHVLVAGLADQAAVDRELGLIEKSGVALVTLADAHYPELLRHIAVPPPVLYAKGVLSSGCCMAIVGSRKGTAYARSFVQSVMPDLAAAGCSIVSGGAVGVDTMAHQAALEHGAKTVAVIGSGLLNPYPACNKKLFDAMIAHGGALISPFALNIPPTKSTFPARNRVISGLSRGVIVVQAALRSGTHITAHYALEQGREVFAVPGPFNDSLSAGCHALIGQGARVVVSAYDILTELGLSGCGASSQPACGAQRADKRGQEIETVSDQATSLETRVVAACRYPVCLDELVEKLGVDRAELCDCLFQLQMNGTVEQNFAGLFKAL